MSYYPHPDEYIFIFLRCVLETFLLGGFFYLIYRKTDLKAWFPFHLYRFFYIFLALWLFVQLTDRFQYHFPQKYGFYPLTRFAMYQIGHPKKVQTVYEILVDSESSKNIPANPTKLYEAIGLSSINTRFQTYLRFLQSENQLVVRRAKQDLTLFFESISRHPSFTQYQTLTAFRFIAKDYSLSSPDLTEPVDKKVLFSWQPRHLK